MNSNLLLKVILIIAVIVGACLFAFPLDKKINLGLDLQGGMHLILEVDTSNLSEEAKNREIQPLMMHELCQIAIGEKYFGK